MLELNGAISAVATLMGIAKGALDARDDAKAKQAIAEANMKLVDLSMSALMLAERNSSLSEEVSVLQRELRDTKMKLEERERYTLAEVRPGAYAYAGKPGQEGDDPEPPYFCQPCYDKGVKAVLRRIEAKAGTNAAWYCPESQTHQIAIPGTALPHPPMPRRGGFSPI